MIKTITFLTKKPGLTTEEFIEYYEQSHVPLILSLGTPPLSYTRNYLVTGDELNKEDPSVDFDVVTELVFADRESLLAWRGEVFNDQTAPLVIADEENFLNRDKRKSYVVEERKS
jgi:hypothetical protein